MKKMVTSLVALGTLGLALGLQPATSAQAASTTITLKIFANVGPPGTATLHIKVGDDISVTATGDITGPNAARYGFQGAPPCGPGNPTTVPDGSEYLSGKFCGEVTAGPGAPMQGQPVGLLVGHTRLANGQFTDPFAVAASRSWTATNDGTLYLEYNDTIYSDNSGYYTVTVTDNGP